MTTFVELARVIIGRDDVGLAADVVDGAIAEPLRGRVPATLLQFLREIGGASELLAGFHRFRGAADLELHKDHLLFLDENQDVIVWAVPLGEDDPFVVQFPVVDGALDGPFPEGARLSEFLRAMVIMQATHGDLMPHVGYVEREADASLLLLEAGLSRVAVVGELTAFAGADTVATTVADDDGETVLVATSSMAAFKNFADKLEVEVDIFEL